MEKKQDIVIKELLKTGLNSGSIKENFNISPQSTASLTANNQNLIVGAEVEKNKSRLVVIGSETLADDQFLKNNRDNISFLANTIDYLANDKDIVSMLKKPSNRAVFQFRNQKDVYITQYGNLLKPPLAVFLFAFYFLKKRKLKTQRVYEG